LIPGTIGALGLQLGLHGAAGRRGARSLWSGPSLRR
jgi:hypothetical protein